MNITTERSQELWHDLQEPGAYEWWYFDAEDKKNGLSIVLIWFGGFPFSPFYMQHYEEWKKGKTAGPPFPSNYSGFSFQLYENGKETVNFIREGSNGLFESNREEIGVRFEQNRFTYDQEQDEYRISVDFSFPARTRKISATLVFKPLRRVIYSKKDGNNSGHVPRHQWLLSVPRAAVEGSIDITEGRSDISRRIHVEADGYHDHNLGTMPMQEYIKKWYWGRAFSEEFDLIYYVIFFKNDHYQPVSLLMLHDNRSNQMRIMEDVAFSEHNFSRGVFSPLHGRVLELRHANVLLSIHQHKVLDAGPFYLRFASTISLRADGEHLNGISGISEFLNPSCLRSKVMRFFIKSRIWRDGVPSIMYNQYNYIKNHFDWFRK
ncbi:MAG: carotenoid 1,2-hydratase [Chlorobium sp.]|jgi:carotenoid 1,2-hydratase|nr:carotenoid 1,2-hydratase [Chlorobium sp.]